ncbi:MAG: polysaccharide deacetylase family protein [Chitinophagaceae bacterium]
MNIIERAYKKIKRQTVGIVDQSMGLAGLYDKAYKQARGNRILIYHGICKEDHTKFNPIFLTKKTFENHLGFYKKYFNVLSLDDFFWQRFSIDKFNVCLTFDDGLANNYDYVLPLLKKYEVPATFFVTGIRDAGYDILWNDFLNIITHYGPQQLSYKGESYTRNEFGRYISDKTGIALADSLRSTGFLEKKEMMDELSRLVDFKKNIADRDYWLQMTEEQIREMSASPWADIGCHGYYHNDLAKISIAGAKDEMIRSKHYLQNITGQEVKALAFPYGSYSEEVKAEAKDLGFTQLLTMEFNDDADYADPVMRERLTLNPLIPVHAQMQATIKGNYDRWK